MGGFRHYLKWDANTDVSSSEFGKILKNNYSLESLRTAASESWKNQSGNALSFLEICMKEKKL